MSDPIAMTPEIASKYAIYGLLANNCYHEEKKPPYLVERIGWWLVDTDGDRTQDATKESVLTGFAYDIYEHENSNDAVIAFRGTDSLKDWALSNLAVPFSIPYKQANKAVRIYLQMHPQKNLTLVGHSLGGGMALGASSRFGVPAITFDPSPRIFDGLGDYHENALRVVIYQNGEILEEVRNRWSKVAEVVKPENVYECRYDFDKANAHRIDVLSLRLAQDAATVNPEIARVIAP